jgi:hypothetical protein
VFRSFEPKTVRKIVPFVSYILGVHLKSTTRNGNRSQL